MNKGKNIGDLLIDYGKITADDLEEGLRLQKAYQLRLGETLIKLGKVTKDDIEWVLSKQLDIPFVIVENVSLDHRLIGKFDKELLIENLVLPLYETDEEIAIATDDPLNKEVFASMAASSGKRITLSSGNGEKIREILTSFFSKEGIPALTNTIKQIAEKLTGTSFYRIDFIVTENSCEIAAYGFGIHKNLALLPSSYTRAQILETFESMGMGCLYLEHMNGGSCCLSVFPLLNRIDDIRFPAVIGTFGLFIPNGVAFSDMKANNIPLLFHSHTPIPGYIFITAKTDAPAYEKIACTVDGIPHDAKNFYVHTPVPQVCRSCHGNGCTICHELGHLFPKTLNGRYASKAFRGLVTQRKAWQK